ncbi:VOC family protein [Actinokineospora sp. HUAS TT18]|uniref:VOC family protein n=1 Tax=Actinokineospora sp. HUAS TT18 TaxID=3447451 RepID=UPI003F520650
MTSLIHSITVDSSDPYALGTWWSGVIGLPVHPDDQPGDEAVLIELPAGPRLLFVQVPEAKSVKNRVHLDLCPKGTRDEEVERLIGLGATLVDDQRRPDGRGWVVLADPEGNEFCVERGEAERAAAE